jgi:hypothetical protein
MISLGRLLLVFGLVMAGIGLLIVLAGKSNLPIGRLPGDFTFRRGSFTFYFPLATSIVLSILLSIVIWFLNRR